MILLDKMAAYAPLTPIDEVHFCTGAFTPEELLYLQTFIGKTYGAYQASLSSGVPDPFGDLWINVFSLFTGGPLSGGPPFGLTPPPPGILPQGFLAEACTIFTLFKFQQQLTADTAASENGTDVDSIAKSAIYKSLKNILLNSATPRFKKPTAGQQTEEFHRMMHPDRHIGMRKFQFNGESLRSGVEQPIKHEMYDLIVTKHDRFFDHDALFRMPFNDRKTFVLTIIDSILSEYSDKIGKLVDLDSACAFKILSGGASPATSLYLAAGDGSNTSGLFDKDPNPVPDNGVLLFNYKYDGAGGVNDTAERTFSSLSSRKSTAVHLTMFGLDMPHISGSETPDSSIEVTQDEITYRFVANKNQPMTPVNGISTCYDNVSQYFYEETISGRRNLARYFPDKRELLFTEGETFSFTVKLTSAHDNPNYEEVAVCINVVEGQEHMRCDFEAHDLFANDVFVVTETRCDALTLTLLNDPKIVSAIDFMIDRLINFANIPIFINLRGNFIGKVLDPLVSPSNSAVGKDNTYQFYQPRPVVEPPPGTPPPLGYRALETTSDLPGYDALRYSFASVISTESDINMTIDSFVSPLRSRLDKHVHSGKQAQLDLLTNYCTINGSDAYLDPPSDYISLMGDHPKLPSYNPILSGLRSFGVAEALMRIIGDRADSIASGKGYDAFDIGVMKAQLQAKLEAAVVPQNIRLGIGADIKFQDYTDFKP